MFDKEDDNNDFEEESEQHRRGYLHAIDDVQRKIKFINRDVIINKGSFNQNQSSSSQHNTQKKNEKHKDPIVYKESENKMEKNKRSETTNTSGCRKNYYNFQFANNALKIENFHSFQSIIEKQGIQR